MTADGQNALLPLDPMKPPSNAPTSPIWFEGNFRLNWNDPRFCTPATSMRTSTFWFTPATCCAGLIVTLAWPPGVGVGVRVSVGVAVGQTPGHGVDVAAGRIVTLPFTSEPIGIGLALVVVMMMSCSVSAEVPGVSDVSVTVAIRPLPLAPGTCGGSSVTQLNAIRPGFGSGVGPPAGVPVGVGVASTLMSPGRKHAGCRPVLARNGPSSMLAFRSNDGSNATRIW